jgi:hypothetical protein
MTLENDGPEIVNLYIRLPKEVNEATRQLIMERLNNSFSSNPPKNEDEAIDRLTAILPEYFV